MVQSFPLQSLTRHPLIRAYAILPYMHRRNLFRKRVSPLSGRFATLGNVASYRASPLSGFGCNRTLHPFDVLLNPLFAPAFGPAVPA